jgi:hypothetical protein
LRFDDADANSGGAVAAWGAQLRQYGYKGSWCIDNTGHDFDGNKATVVSALAAYPEIIPEYHGNTHAAWGKTGEDTTGASGFYKTELVDGRAYLQAQLGVTMNNFCVPESTPVSVDDASALQYQGIKSTSSTYGANGFSWNVANLDLQKLIYMPTPYIVGSTEALTRRMVAALAEDAAQNGRVYVFLSHKGDISTANWAIVLNELSLHRDITVTDQGTFANLVKAGAPWTTTDNRNYTRTWTDSGNYTPTGTTFCYLGNCTSSDNCRYDNKSYIGPIKPSGCIYPIQMGGF